MGFARGESNAPSPPEGKKTNDDEFTFGVDKVDTDKRKRRRKQTEDGVGSGEKKRP
jgi:hypothetical protein